MYTNLNIYHSKNKSIYLLKKIQITLNDQSINITDYIHRF